MGENTEKYITFPAPIEKEVIRTDNSRKKSQKIDPTDYKLLIAQDLWQAHYQILSIILLKEFIKLNKNMDMITKKVKFAELNTKTVPAFLNTKALTTLKTLKT